MGRLPSDPLEQIDKGFPSRRRRKTQEAAAALEQSIASDAPDDGRLPIPRKFRDAPKRWEIASHIWEQQASVLVASGRAQTSFRPALARYCIWSQIFEHASDQLGRECRPGNYTIVWKLGHGGEKIIPHPALDIMQDAEGILRALDAEFGFTPRADNDLTRVEVYNGRQLNLPLGNGHGAQPHSPGQPPPPNADPMDLMNDADSPGPSRMN